DHEKSAHNTEHRVIPFMSLPSVLAYRGRRACVIFCRVGRVFEPTGCATTGRTSRWASKTRPRASKTRPTLRGCLICNNAFFLGTKGFPWSREGGRIASLNSLGDPHAASEWENIHAQPRIAGHTADDFRP